MVSVPVRAVPVFAATEYETLPLPLPLLDVVSQVTLLLADHVQPEVVVTVSEPEEALDPTVALVGASE